MTLPSSGQISIADIYYEFPGTVDFTPSTSPALSYYYRGGNNVPNIPTNNNIPTSGQISLSNFYGGIGYFNYNIVFDNNLEFNFNLTSSLISTGWDTVKPVYAKISVTNESVITSFAASVPAFRIPVLPLGSVVYLTIQSGSYIAGGPTSAGTGGVGLQIEHSNTILVNSGGIYGGAGKGGNGQGTTYGSATTEGSAGTAGGHGLVINLAALIGTGPSITNYGVIAGGGGGGGGGGQYCVATACGGTPTFCAAGGGGGGGRFANPYAFFAFITGGNGGPNAGTYCPITPPFYEVGAAGGNGLPENAGAGGAGGANSGARGGNGGDGGDFGEAGNTGGIGYAGGAGGYAKYTPSGSSTTVRQGDTYGTWA